MNEIPWDDIDEGIRPLVRLLNDEGIETFSSCSGHKEGDFPWIGCKTSDRYDENDIINALTKHRYTGFTISLSRQVKNLTHRGEHMWEITFWGKNCIKPRKTLGKGQ